MDVVLPSLLFFGCVCLLHFPVGKPVGSGGSGHFDDIRSISYVFISNGLIFLKISNKEQSNGRC